MRLVSFAVLCIFVATTTSAQEGQPPAGLTYDKRTAVMNAPKCNASETYLKKKVKAQLATYYADYPYIAVDFDSFKGQHGYTDKNDPTRFVYPYKIEMKVYLKRTVMKDSVERNEYVIWKYDSEYEYATSKGKKCEFSIVPSSQITLITRQVY